MSYSDVSFPKGSVVLVTGAAGFIGSNIVDELLNFEVDVIGLDNLSTGKIINLNLAMKAKNFKFIEGDIRSIDTCLEATQGIDYVIHQAALGSVPGSIENPLLYEDNNVAGTLNMLEASRKNNVKKFVYASSSSVYGDKDVLPKIEGEEDFVLSPYALTKLTNEKYAKLYTDLYDLECVGLRYFNVFGKRQDPDSQYSAVIPKFIKNLKNGKQVEIYGDGEQSRDFTYVQNVVEANIKACLSGKESSGKAYNIACNESLSINVLYNIIKRYFVDASKPMYLEPRKGDVKHSLACIDLAKSLLQYEPSWDFESGFEKTIQWYMNNLD